MPAQRARLPVGRRRAPLTILFDAECAFCTALADLAERLDQGAARLRHHPPRLRLVPLQRAEDLPGRPDLALVARSHPLGDEIHVVDASGKVSSGGLAVIVVASELPMGSLVRVWSHLPGSGRLADGVYRLVAGQRGKLGRLLRVA